MTYHPAHDAILIVEDEALLRELVAPVIEYDGNF
jgi:hypothetical protein